MQGTLVKSNPWFLLNSCKKSSSIRIFCLPYAGGGASVYHSWVASAPNHIEVCPIQLPGRENRISEELFDNIQLLTKELATQIEPHVDKPYALFGHSMGALIVFELARELRRRKIREPERLFFSGRIAPHVPRVKPPIHDLDHQSFLKCLYDLNGTPESILQNEELMELFMPMLRNDFKMVETYEYIDEAPLNIPFSVLRGSEDSETSAYFMNEWSKHTVDSCIQHLIKGNHFFLNDQPQKILDLINEDLSFK